ncbi:fatty-acid--CoA ligase [Mycobacterium sp. MYCO198283]|uniref:fatty-acid--CoA ligase n=1 Tax=Mycobacterium sp. MYCO198283 TaxID=2883505 RepID=UPI001E4185E9|nr:fatty-acid--CoA ligase [Mycobacterium sp. MYCO198283]MCG5434253.1 fatty-acid--CoA ligase [Mycobacterium sp. MYCO198283]
MTPTTAAPGGQPRSFVIVSDYRVPDPSRVIPLLRRRQAALADIGAHHVLVYLSTREPDRVLVMIVVRNREPVVDLLRSRVFFDWFDDAGVTDIPAVFAGELVERLDVGEHAEPQPPPTMVAAFAAVDDVPRLMASVHRALPRFVAAGIQTMWVFRAFDDDHEVLTLTEIVDERRASAWIKRPDEAAEWMAGAGMGAYPPLFVGRFEHLIRIEPAG